MNILREYTWASIRKNKRTGLAIMTAVLLMSTMMSCLCGFLYTTWTDSVRISRLTEGDWHGELFDTTYGRDLEIIENYASVSAVLIKGQWEVAKLEDKGRRNYLILRGADKNYWESMPEKETLMEGRQPRNSSELALSKQYFENHQEVKLGDTLTLPTGSRVYQGQICPETDGFHQGETFVQTGTKSYTLVGKLDITTPSVVPAYTGMTFLSPGDIAPEDQLTVYLRFNNMRKTYKELPALAQSLGWKADEYGNYQLRYNAGLLTKYGILSPQQHSALSRLSAWGMPLMFLVVAVLVTALFVLVIHNAFALSANERLSQLGLLSGIGATPRQIRASLLFEGLLLSAVPLPVGTFFGWLLNQGLFTLINQNSSAGRDGMEVIPSFGFPAVLPAVILSFLTVWLSVRIPAKKIEKLMPIDAIRQGDSLNDKKIPKAGWMARCFGIEGDLAGSAIQSRKKSYRTATISLTLSFLLLTGVLYIWSAQQAAAEVYSYDYEDVRHIQVDLLDGRRPDGNVLKEIRNTPGVSSAAYYNKLPCAAWVTEQDAAEDLVTHLGGFQEIVSMKKYSPIEREGKYRIFTNLIGMDEESFRKYCESLGIDPEPYFKDPSMAIFYNRTEDPNESTRKKSVYRDLLKLTKGQSLTFTEKAFDEDTGTYQFPLTVGTIAQELPPVASRFSRFTLAAVMPMEHVLDLASHCSEKRQRSGSSVSGLILTPAKEGISYPLIRETTDRINRLLTKYYGTGDYAIDSLAEKKDRQEHEGRVMHMAAAGMTGLLALIGLSNVWAGISGNLRQRDREFAVLRSVGLSPRQLQKMLLLEGIFLGLRPLVFSLPFQAAILAAFLYINELTLPEYLPHAPAAVILGYTLLVLLAVCAAYAVGIRRLKKKTIIDAIRDDTL